MASISTLLSNAWNYLRKFNLFQKAKRDDEHEIQNEIISTRLFLFLMAASIIILLVYTSQVKMTLSITHNSPTLELYQSLYEDYGKTLVCPCTNIAIAQKQFISLTRTVHQICRSDFITDKWFSFLNAASTLYISSDFRFTGSLLFQIIASFCHLSDDAIQNGLNRFFLFLRQVFWTIHYFVKGQSRQQVQQFAGLLAIKSTFQDQIIASVKPKVSTVCS